MDGTIFNILHYGLVFIFILFPPFDCDKILELFLLPLNLASSLYAITIVEITWSPKLLKIKTRLNKFVPHPKTEDIL